MLFFIRRLCFLLLAAVLTGCAGRPVAILPSVHTLTGNDRLPHAEMEKLSQSRQWALMRNLEYSGYVIMEGRIDEDDRVHVSKLSESYPDNSRDRLALALGNKTVIHARNIGSRIEAKAEVYVIFYEKLNDANLAFIYARQVDYMATEGSGAACYLNTVTY